MAKYHNTPVVIDGLRFDSKRELARYRELVLLRDAGVISDLVIHPRYTVMDGYNRKDGTHVTAITYVGDFEYIENGQKVVEDVKGVETQVFRIKRKLFERCYPSVDFRIVR